MALQSAFRSAQVLAFEGDNVFEPATGSKPKSARINWLVSPRPSWFACPAKKPMTIEELTKQIRTCADRMDALYGKVVFDEWAVVSLARNRGRIVSYHGPRNDDFLKNFANDLGALRTELLDSRYAIGDFEFARHAVGTGFEAFMVLGNGLYLICNNTATSMEEITRNPKWLNAQVPFAEMSDRIRSSPAVV
jgi:hypothetical protein